MDKCKIPTPYMIALKKKMMDTRDIAESSANLYISNLVMLNNKTCFTNVGFLKKNRDEIIEHLSQYEPNTELSYLTSIVAALSTMSDNKLYGSTFKFYSQLHREKLGIKRGEDSKAKTKESSKDWIEWEDVKKVYNNLKAEVLAFSTGNNITKIQYEKLIDLVVLSLYVLVPPRRNQDYLHMYILQKGYKKETLDHDNKNYYDVDEEEFIFGKYKTKKTHGIQKEDVPEELVEILNLLIKYHPVRLSNPKVKEFKLLVNANGEAGPCILVNYITLRLNKIFTNYYGHKRNIGASQLRHSFISSTFGDEFQKMSRVASAMGHSVGEQRQYARYDATSSDSDSD